MLSLSIFSSSQRISVAVYDGFKLKSFVEKEIEFNKIDNIFLLLKKVLKNREKKIKKIFYSVGPGSFTAIRSIKSIAEAISAVYKAEIKTITDFEIYLTRPVKKGKDVIVFFEVTRNKFFYKYFKYQNKSFEPDTSFYSEKLDEVLKFIEEKKISAGHAKILVGLDNAEFIANKIIEKKLSVRQSENFVKIFKKKKISINKSVDPNIQNLEKSISDKIGLNVSIKINKRNKGTITFEYKELDQLNKIIEAIKKNY